MNRYLTGFDTVLAIRGALAYIEHRPESRNAMRAEFQSEIARALTLRRSVPLSDRRRLAIELHEVRVFLRMFEHAETTAPSLTDPPYSTTLQ